jgi:hypothetical protein
MHQVARAPRERARRVERLTHRQPDEVDDPMIGEHEIEVGFGQERHDAARRAQHRDDGEQRLHGPQEVAVRAGPETTQGDGVALDDRDRPEPPDCLGCARQHGELGSLDVELEEIEPIDAARAGPGVEPDRGCSRAGRSDVAPGRERRVEVEHDVAVGVVEHRALDRHVGHVVGGEVRDEMGATRGAGFERVHVTVRAEAGEQHGQHADVRAAVDGDGVGRERPLEEEAELPLVPTAGAVDLADDADVALVTGDVERALSEWVEPDNLVVHDERRYRNPWSALWTCCHSRKPVTAPNLYTIGGCLQIVVRVSDQ